MWAAVVQSSSTARCMIAGCMPSQGIFFSLFVGFADSIIARRCHHTSLLGILDGVLEKQVIIARKTTAPPPPLAMGSKAFSFPPRRTDYVYRTRYGGRWLSFPSAVASPVTSVGRPVSSSHPIHCIRLRSVPSS
ncbi:hypothetical protein BHE74_00053804 [Ensete ventricosum]|nr:hypothetical protein BHE74_00053804 [Ensete ventricosum]